MVEVEEYYCNSCKRKICNYTGGAETGWRYSNTDVCTLDPKTCNVPKASVVCNCGTRVFYPAETPHPHFCSVCEQKEFRKLSARHIKLDMFCDAQQQDVTE